MNPIVEKVYQIGIIPVIAFNSVDEALPLCKALAEGGLPAAEVTFRTACAEECIRKIHEEMHEMLLGAGTVFGLPVLSGFMEPIIIFLLPPGGFFVFGMLVALAGKLSKEGKAPETTGCGNCPLAASCSKAGEKNHGKEAVG